MAGPDGLEAALAATQGDAEAAGKAAGAVSRALKNARAAAATGQVRELRKALDSAVQLAADLAEQVNQVRAAYDIDEPALLDSGAYTKELLAAAAAVDLQMFEEDGRLLCYPSLVRILPGEAAIEIDRRRERRIRPSAVVESLRRAQQAGPRFKAGPFLASLAAGYDLQVARQGKGPGAVIKLLDVYGVLTLLPGQGREYAKQEFARDLYLLDQNGTTRAADGRQLRWAASTGTKQAGVLMTVARSGQQQRYWGIAFDDPGRDA